MLQTDNILKQLGLLHTPPKIDNENPFWVPQYGYSSKEIPGHEIRINSDISCIQYVLSGSGVVISDRFTTKVTKGDTFLLLEGSDQNYYSDPDDPIEKIWFNFRGKLSIDIIKAYELDKTIVFRNLHTEELISQMHKVCDNNYDNPKKCQHEMLIQFVKIVQFLADNKPINDTSEIADYLRYYIDSHITENLKLEDISKNANISKEHLIRLFKKKYGTTPHQYMIQCRIKIASSMLKITNLSIEQISDKLNYCDPHHFSEQFAKHIGCRPSEYRRNSRQNI